MNLKDKLVVLITSCLLIAPVINVTTGVNADAEPQFSERELSHDTWHQTPAAHNINDVRVLKFNRKAPIGVGSYEVLINGHKFNAAGDSPLGRQIKAHQKAMKKQQAKMKMEQIKQQRERQRKQLDIQRAKRRARQKAKKAKSRNLATHKKSTPSRAKAHHQTHYGVIAIGVVVIIVLGSLARMIAKHRNR